jgi:hypothetical protein
MGKRQSKMEKAKDQRKDVEKEIKPSIGETHEE